MGITVTTSGEAPRFDIFDNGLALLALHSACLALAFTAIKSAEPMADAFNLTWMAAGFAFGAVLAVLAAYYGTINAKALGPQLIGLPQTDATAPRVGEELAVSEEALEILEESDDASPDAPSWFSQPAAHRPEIRSRLIATAVVLALFLLVGAAINRVADMVDARHVAAATAEAAKPPQARDPGRTEAGAAAGPAKAADTPAARSARIKTAESEAIRSNNERRWRAWMIIGLAGLVLLPLPFAWSGPSQFLSAARGFLVLGSLLSFVLGVGVALLPLAANSVGEGISQAVSEDQNLPGADRAGVVDRGGADPVTVRVETRGQTSTGGGDRPPVAEPAVTPADIARLENRIGDLQGAFANAAAARDVRVTMTDPRPAPVLSVHPLPVEVEPEVTVVGFAGEQGERGEQGDRGAPGPVRECTPSWAPPWFRTCKWVAAPEIGSPAPNGPA